MDPSVRLYTMHRGHHVPLDFQVYRFDIEKANQDAREGREPVMDYFMDFKGDFDLQDLSPSSHALLAQQILLDPATAQTYSRFTNKHVPDPE